MSENAFPDLLKQDPATNQWFYDTERLAEPPWREYKANAAVQPISRAVPIQDPREQEVARRYEPTPEKMEYQVVRAALALRRPILVTGPPGVGKSSLAQKVAHDLGLGKVLNWSVDSETRVEDGLYSYDAIARLQEGESANTQEAVGRFFRLGPLGTALLPTRFPRVLLIDEVDKCGPSLPNDLLNVFENGRFEIEELARLRFPSVKVRPYDSVGESDTVEIHDGKVGCYEFPLVIATSNGDRDFPQAFKRRCLRYEVRGMEKEQMERVVYSWFPDLKGDESVKTAIKNFIDDVEHHDKRKAVDQLLGRFFLERLDRDFQARTPGAGFVKLDEILDDVVEKDLDHIEGSSH